MKIRTMMLTIGVLVVGYATLSAESIIMGDEVLARGGGKIGAPLIPGSVLSPEAARVIAIRKKLQELDEALQRIESGRGDNSIIKFRLAGMQKDLQDLEALPVIRDAAAADIHTKIQELNARIANLGF